MMVEDQLAHLQALAARLQADAEQRRRVALESMAKRFAILLAGDSHVSPEAHQAALEAVVACVNIESVPTPMLDSINVNFPVDDKGHSLKPANILVIEPWVLLRLIGAGWLALKSEWGDPLSFVVASCIFVHELVQHFTVSFSRSEAAIIYTMWQRRNVNWDVEEEGLLEAVNKTLQQHGDRPISEAEYQACISRFLELRIIERSGVHAEKWRLRESVSVSYDR